MGELGTVGGGEVGRERRRIGRRRAEGCGEFGAPSLEFGEAAGDVWRAETIGEGVDQVGNAALDRVQVPLVLIVVTLGLSDLLSPRLRKGRGEAFEQFGLDTVGNWENETKCHPLIALATTKDVQDAILADPKREAIVDVICFRYWWQTDKGLFAPKGGQNLSPRQFERKWDGGSPTDEDLAAMAAGYRPRFPDKVVIASGEDERLRGSWAFLCAGGSMPDLPATTDAKLLAAIPQMQPWVEVSGPNRWALREPGKQILIYSGDNAPAELDLSAESGVFHVNDVNERTGAATEAGTVQAGGKVKLPDSKVVWLVKE